MEFFSEMPFCFCERSERKPFEPGAYLNYVEPLGPLLDEGEQAARVVLGPACVTHPPLRDRQRLQLDARVETILTRR